MITIDELRSEQERRLTAALESWNEAKKHLERAIVAAEAREREFREASEDVRRRIEALDFVAGMAEELNDEIPGRLRVVVDPSSSAKAERDEQLTTRTALAGMDRELGEESSLRDQAA